MTDCEKLHAMVGHFPEHEDRTKLIIENTSCIAAMKRERDHQFRQMKDLQDEIFSKLNNLERGKVDMGTFKWLMTGVGAVAMLILITLMAQFGTMINIEADLRIMSAEVKGLSK